MKRRAHVRIGAGAGFWGDSAEGPRQLVESGDIDYLVLDYLAEITMSILARNRAKNADLGYATDFPDVVAALAPTIQTKGIRIVTNAGGVNPRACQRAIQEKLDNLGIPLRVGVVVGDDLLGAGDTYQAEGIREMFNGDAFPARPLSINAYLGAFPIAALLDAGADIVLTGRCVDSALVLGPLIHEFGWGPNDLDLLAAGSLAGHVIECGCQATGGITTDWALVADDWDRMGYPVAECYPDGRFVLCKPPNTGGRITPETVAEQIVYEIGDPGAYVLPDVCCDLRQVTVHAVGENRVEVRGARGNAPPDDYKVSATYQDGYRCMGTMLIGGPLAPEKARRVGDALLQRTRRLMQRDGYGDYRRTDVEVLGAESNWGANARARTREVLLKIALHHDDRRALEYFAREVFASAASMAQGTTGFAGGRPTIAPLVRLFSFTIPKNRVNVTMEMGAACLYWNIPDAGTDRTRGGPDAGTTAWPSSGPMQTEAAQELLGPAPASVPLIALAYGRSGDKGDKANIGIMARKPDYVRWLRAALTPEAVHRYLAHLVEGPVERFEIPGLQGFNFLLHGALGGGGVASLRYDPQGKMLAQILMDFPVPVPQGCIDRMAVAKGASSAG